MPKWECTKHPKYKAIRPPTSKCKACLIIYLVNKYVWKNK